MDKNTFEHFIEDYQQVIDEIRNTAYAIHDGVGQKYGKTLPYGYHLSMVVDAAIKYGSEVVAEKADILPVIFAAFFHDSIEDARLTYNDIKALAIKYMTAEQAYTAAEIVYALTNDKGRTRQERAGEHYYAGIRETPYAPFVKLCDRIANMTFSFQGTGDKNNHMHKVYESEWPHFLQAITVDTDDIRYTLPKDMIDKILALFVK